MNEGNAELLSQLRDIHAASEPGWWPPAPGWWLLVLIVLVLVFLALRYVYNKWLAIRRRRRLLSELNDITDGLDPEENPHEYLARLNRFFRAIALRAFPGTACARLQGSEWVSFIQSLLPDGLSSEGLSALASGPYQPTPEFDPGSLEKLARTWVSKYG